MGKGFAASSSVADGFLPYSMKITGGWLFQALCWLLRWFQLCLWPALGGLVAVANDLNWIPTTHMVEERTHTHMHDKLH